MQRTLQGDSGWEELLWAVGVNWTRRRGRTRAGAGAGAGSRSRSSSSSSVAVQHFACKKRVSGPERARVCSSPRALSLRSGSGPGLLSTGLFHSNLIRFGAADQSLGCKGRKVARSQRFNRQTSSANQAAAKWDHPCAMMPWVVVVGRGRGRGTCHCYCTSYWSRCFNAS
jgi:hypothetical protein